MGVAIALFVAIVAAYALYRAGRGRLVDRGLPSELRGASIALAEQTFRSPRFGLIARLDRAYRLSGVLTLVELKTRDRDVVHLSDRIELSVQRLAVSDVLGEEVSDSAWVIVQDRSRTRRPHRVRLLDAQQVLQLKSRYDAIISGNAEHLAPATGRMQCRSCGQFRSCSQKYRDR